MSVSPISTNALFKSTINPPCELSFAEGGSLPNWFVLSSRKSANLLVVLTLLAVMVTFYRLFLCRRLRSPFHNPQPSPGKDRQSHRCNRFFGNHLLWIVMNHYSGPNLMRSFTSSTVYGWWACNMRRITSSGTPCVF